MVIVWGAHILTIYIWHDLRIVVRWSTVAFLGTGGLCFPSLGLPLPVDVAPLAKPTCSIRAKFTLLVIMVRVLWGKMVSAWKIANA